MEEILKGINNMSLRKYQVVSGRRNDAQSPQKVIGGFCLSYCSRTVQQLGPNIDLSLQYSCGQKNEQVTFEDKAPEDSQKPAKIDSRNQNPYHRPQSRPMHPPFVD